MIEGGRRPQVDQVNTIDVAIGRRLRGLRAARGLSGEALAARAGIGHGRLQRYEAGLERLPAAGLCELARLLDVPVGSFFEAVTPSREPDPAEPDGQGPRLVHAFDALTEVQKRAVYSLVQSLSLMHEACEADHPPRRRDAS